MSKGEARTDLAHGDFQRSAGGAPGRMRVTIVLGLGVLGVSTAATLIRYAECAPLAKASWRCALAACFLGIAGGWRSRESQQFGDRFRASGVRPRDGIGQADRNAPRLAILAGAFLAFHFGTWIASLDYTSVAISSVLVSTTPIWVALLAPLVTPDRPSKRALAGVALSLLGSAWIALDSDGLGAQKLGAGLAIAGALGAAGYILVGRRVGHRLPMGRYLFLCYGSAAVFLVLAALLNGDDLIGFERQTWLALLGLALFPQLLGHSACNWALRWMPALLVSVVFLAEPILASVIAWLLLAEAPGLVVLLAAPIIFLGILLAADRRSPAP